MIAIVLEEPIVQSDWRRMLERWAETAKCFKLGDERNAPPPRAVVRTGYSTVTLFARVLGLSTSVPRTNAT